MKFKTLQLMASIIESTREMYTVINFKCANTEEYETLRKAIKEDVDVINWQVVQSDDDTEVIKVVYRGTL